MNYKKALAYIFAFSSICIYSSEEPTTAHAAKAKKEDTQGQLEDLENAYSRWGYDKNAGERLRYLRNQIKRYADLETSLTKKN